MSAIKQLKQAFIKQAHAQDKMIAFAIFVKELEEDLETAQWIFDEFGHEFEAAMQMHMKNMMQGQLMLNAGLDYSVKTLLKHIEALATDGNTDAMAAAMQAIDKAKMH